jgi:hypothetical protein
MPTTMPTSPTSADVSQFIAAIDDPARRAEGQALVRLLGEITNFGWT